MTTAVQSRARLDRVDKGEWLSRLLDDVQTQVAYEPSLKAVMRMRTRIFERMEEKVKVAA